MNTKTLYLHVGMPKTGTTALQSFCANNGSWLEKNGLIYPVMKYYFRHCSQNRNAHFLLVKDRAKLARYEKKRYTKKLRESMFDEIFSSFTKTDKVLISDEAFWYTKDIADKAITGLKERCDKQGVNLKIVAYLRRQDEVAESWYAQRVKMGLKTGGFQDFLEKVDEFIPLHYEKRLGEFSDIVGKDNVIVRIYHKGLIKDNGLIKDYLKTTGVDAVLDEGLTLHMENESISDNYTEIMRWLNMLYEKDEEYSSENRFFRDSAVGCSVKFSEKRGMFSGAEAEEFLSCYEEENRRVNRDYMGNDAPLFEAKKREKEQWSADNPEMLHDLAVFFGDVIWRQQQEIRTLRKFSFIYRLAVRLKIIDEQLII
ncbi:MAG: hypothetical protein K6C95_07755 [Lachnospiraceae bacterium]|nr:hypothetical protein [Lachnospiraceae bacterium]